MFMASYVISNDAGKCLCGSRFAWIWKTEIQNLLYFSKCRKCGTVRFLYVDNIDVECSEEEFEEEWAAIENPPAEKKERISLALEELQ